jgi:hypothetical protein
VVDYPPTLARDDLKMGRAYITLRNPSEDITHKLKEGERFRVRFMLLYVFFGISLMEDTVHSSLKLTWNPTNSAHPTWFSEKKLV